MKLGAYLRSCRGCTHRSLLVLLIAATALAIMPARPAAASHCPITSGSSGNWFGGIQYYPPGGFSGTTIAIRSDLWNYTPSPIFVDTSFWVMLVKDSTHYVQVGWLKKDEHSAAYVFSEYRDGGLPVLRYYNAATGEWGMTPATTPTAAVEYKTTWVTDGSVNQFQNQYNGGNAQIQNLSFRPIGYVVSGETLNFATASPTNKGDHTAGDRINGIHADSIRYYESGTGGWHDAVTPFTWNVPAGNHSTDTGIPEDPIIGKGFRVWDNRCDD